MSSISEKAVEPVDGVDAEQFSKASGELRRLSTFVKSLSPELRNVLEAFHDEHNGDQVSLEEVRMAAEKWKLSKGDRACFDIKAFPESLKKELSVFDVSNDGLIDKSELAAAAHMYAKSKRQVSILKKIIGLLAVLLLLLCVATFLLSWLAAEVSKEVHVEKTGLTYTPEGNVVGTADITEDVELQDWPLLDLDTLRSVTDVSFEDGISQYLLKVGSIVKTKALEADVGDEEDDATPGNIHMTATSGQSVSIFSNGSIVFEGRLMDAEEDEQSSQGARRLAKNRKKKRNRGRGKVKATTAPKSPKCMSWCMRTSHDWADKCGLKVYMQKKCGACEQCKDPAEDDGACSKDCASFSTPWKRKCTWERCTACTQCSDISQTPDTPSQTPDTPNPKKCSRWCLQRETTWEEKCTHFSGNCRGCTECDQATYPASQGCAAACSEDILQWEVKCVQLYECKGCGPCTEGYNPAAEVPPPTLGSPPPFAMIPASIADANDQLDVESIDSPSLEVTVSTGIPYMLSLTWKELSADPAPMFHFEGSVPAGLNVNLRNSVVTWQPDSGQTGLHSVVITAAVSGAIVRRLSLNLSVSYHTDNPDGIYVWLVGGSDENGDGSSGSPFATVEYAATAAIPGDTIYVRGGSYLTSRQDIVVDGTPEEPVLITRLPGERVRLVAKRKRHIFVVPQSSAGLIFRGFELDGNAYNDHWTVLRRSWWRVNDEVEGGWNGFQINGQHVTVEHCFIHHFNQKGVEIGFGRYVNVRYNLITHIGHTSLSGGGGIHRKWNVNFGEADDPDFFRWDVFGNLVWAIEQRLYSYIPHQKWALLALDEGKPMSFDSTRDKEMKARIAHNLVLYGGVDHIRLMVNSNLQVHNNAIMGESGRTHPTPDGITAKGKGSFSEKKNSKANVFGGKLENMTMFNNLVHTDTGSRSFGMKVDVDEDQFSKEDNPSRINHNYYSGGGDTRPKYMPGVASVPKGAAPSVFRDWKSLDFRASHTLPEGVGVDPTILHHLFAEAEDYAVSVRPTGYRHDHCRNVKEILDYAPKNHVKFEKFGESKYKKDHKAYKFKVLSDVYKKTCKCNDLELIIPHEIQQLCQLH